MGAAKVLTYPLRQIYEGLRKNVHLHSEAKNLAYFYDISTRLARALGLPKKIKGQRTYILIGNSLASECLKRGIFLNKASLEGPIGEVVSAIRASLSLLEIPVSKIKIEKIDEKRLDALRITTPLVRSLKQRISRSYDAFVPIKRMRALSFLVERESEVINQAQSYEQEIALLREERRELYEKIRYLEKGHAAYREIVDAIYQSGSGKSLLENITEMFDVVTKWAYQVIGRSPDSEAAGWVAMGPDGKIGIPYRYAVAQEDFKLDQAEIYTLKRKDAKNRHSLGIPEEQTMVMANDQSGNYIAVKEWEALKLREDLVMVEESDGSRRLFRRNLRPGSEMVKHLVTGKAGKFMAAVAQAVTAMKGYKTAFADVEEIDPASAGLKAGEIIPYVQAGTVIKLVSAGSANPNLRAEKIKKGEEVEELCQKGGLEIGIVNQRLETAIGNVRTSALKPLTYMINDATNFKVRPQNEFLISIVGVKSYFIRTLLEFNEWGEAVCLGCLEVTNPEIIPEKLGREEEKRLSDQFMAGKVFAELASTGIMLKLLQEEINSLLCQYLGEKIYQMVKERRFERLQGERIEDASVMFADISGFTALSDKLEGQPDKVVALLKKLFARLIPLVVRSGGRIDKLVGDCIMADFGVPDTKEQSVVASVMTAIEMQRDLQSLNLREDMRQMYAKYGLRPLGMTIGINTGAVIGGNLGYEGEAGKIEYTVIGDAVNQAARLQHAVIRGHILIGERTHDLLSQEFKQRFLDEVNSYNRDIVRLKRFILNEYKYAGIKFEEAEIDRKLERYLEIYQDMTERDLFLPSVIWAKNKGAICCYYVRWDRHAYRYKFLEEAGIELEAKGVFENQPLSVRETVEFISREPDEKKREGMHTAYLQFLARIGQEDNFFLI